MQLHVLTLSMSLVPGDLHGILELFVLMTFRRLGFTLAYRVVRDRTDSVTSII